MINNLLPRLEREQEPPASGAGAADLRAPLGEVIALLPHRREAALERHRVSRPMPAAPGSDAEFRFDRFHLNVGQRTLQEDGKLVRLGSRAFDLLVALCRRAGEVVPNRELLAAAWPNSVVDEGSVRVHIASLRKAMGDGVGDRRLITNVPLRGYCLVAPVVVLNASARAAEAATSMRPAAVEPRANARLRLPGATGLVGRDHESQELLKELRHHRCVTLVGAGGIGKTSVAFPVARQFGELEGVDVVLVELAALSKPELVPMAIASALGIIVSEHLPLPSIAAHLRTEPRLLLVLDNCEHLIDSVAAAAEHILLHAPGVQLLATSREALRIQGEWVRRLESLTVPPPAMQGKVADAMNFSAVQLFVARAAAGAGAFQLRDEDVPLVCNLCRRLDGIPLALELAAGAIDAVGLKGLVERLGSRLGSRLVMVGRGRRTALPRHQTLRATLDWSHDLLPTEEKDLLAHLSIFRGAFTHAAALAVFGQTAQSLDVCLAGLVSKSMVVSEQSGDSVVYRLLETTREYAAEKLASGPVASDVAHRHARYVLQVVRSADVQQMDLPPPHSLTQARWTDDVREAVHWAASKEETRQLSVSLVAWSAPLWFSLSMLAEYRSLAERALATVDANPTETVDDEEVMRLCEALGHALWHTRGGGEAMTAAFGRALDIAERTRATAYRLRCRWGLWLVCNAEGDYSGSYRLAAQFGDIAAKDDAVVRLTHERMMALGAHFHGDQKAGLAYAQRALFHSRARGSRSQPNNFQFDSRVAALTVTARTLWLQGFPEQALMHAEEAIKEALNIDHALSLCYAIAIGAAPVAFWCGDHTKAGEWVALLKRRSDERSLHFWQAFADGYCHLIELERDVSIPGRSLPASGLGVTLRDTLCTIHPAFLDDELLARAQSGDAGWCTPELLRVDGERQAQQGDAMAAIKTFQRGIKVAHQQHALAWELRCGISLARVLRAQGRTTEARKALENVLARFSEGRDTQDLRQAQALLDDLSAS